MSHDPIIEELHQIRADRAALFNNDLRAMVDALKPLEQAWLQTKDELFAGETVDSLYEKIQAFEQGKQNNAG